MEKREQLYEGKAKKVYCTDDPDLLIVSYKDDATALNGKKRGSILGKGAINNRITNAMMQLLEKNGIPTHYVRELNDRETLVKKVDIIPLEVINCESVIGLQPAKAARPELENDSVDCYFSGSGGHEDDKRFVLRNRRQRLTNGILLQAKIPIRPHEKASDGLCGQSFGRRPFFHEKSPPKKLRHKLNSIFDEFFPSVNIKNTV